jgi:SAM-dependent methyltransferase
MHLLMSVGFKAHYFETLAKLEAGNFWFRVRNKFILWALLRCAPELKSFHEIGCGTGFVISAVGECFPEADLSGSEYFEEGLAFAKQSIPRAKFAKIDVRNLPYKAEMDAIGAFDDLEHIEEEETVLQQMHKALKPGGLVFITVPQHRWLWSAVDEDACHARRYDANELHAKATEAGFEIIRSTSFVSFLLPAMHLSRLIARDKGAVEVEGAPGLRVNPILNFIFKWVLRFELVLVRAGFSLPIGGSRLLVARNSLMA